MTTSCKQCEEPLVLEVEPEEAAGEAKSVPDDLELPCGCHFHWQCLLDEAADVAVSMECPSCQRQLVSHPAGPSVTNRFLHSTAEAVILSRYLNEGGLQENLDILPALTEEAYLVANPEARLARAYHVMCSEGDISGIVELLRDMEDSDGEQASLTPIQLLKYQDPLASSKSGLHLAVEKGQEEVVWLLLWVASTLATETLPAAAVSTAQSVGVPRYASHGDDIRSLQDDHGRTAEAIAVEMDGRWSAILEAGLLHLGQ